MSKTDALLTAAILAAALAIGGLWLIDGWIDGQGWVVLTGGKWAMAATGWPLLRQAWPLSLAGGIFSASALYPVLVWVARRQAEASLASRMAEIERQSQGLERKRQAIEQDKRESEARQAASRQELSDMHTRRLAEIEAGAAKARTDRENTLAKAAAEANQAHAEAAEAKTQANIAQKRLESAEKRRKNAAAANARLRKKNARPA